MVIKRGASLARLETAFHTFDLDGSGTVSVANLEEILMRPGTENSMSKVDVADIVAMFDEDGSGSLNLLEFEKAMSMFGSFLTEQKEALHAQHENHKNQALTACAAPYTKEIAEIFGKVDENQTGLITPTDGTVAKDALIFFYDGMGFDFSEEALVEFNQAHDSTDKEGLSLDNFGRFLAELANCDDDLMGGMVESFGEAVDYILAKKAIARADEVQAMLADAKAAASRPEGAAGPKKLNKCG